MLILAEWCVTRRTCRTAVILVVTERAVSDAVTEVLLVDALTRLWALVLPGVASLKFTKFKVTI